MTEENYTIAARVNRLEKRIEILERHASTCEVSWFFVFVGLLLAGFWLTR